MWFFLLILFYVYVMSYLRLLHTKHRGHARQKPQCTSRLQNMPRETQTHSGNRESSNSRNTSRGIESRSAVAVQNAHSCGHASSSSSLSSSSSRARACIDQAEINDNREKCASIHARGPEEQISGHTNETMHRKITSGARRPVPEEESGRRRFAPRR